MTTLCSAVVRGSRLKLWKTKPSFSVRTSARWFGVSRLISWPSNQNSPELGRSRQPRMFINVVLPEPEAPISATSSPWWIVSEMPRSTGTSTSPR